LGKFFSESAVAACNDPNNSTDVYFRHPCDAYVDSNLPSKSQVIPGSGEGRASENWHPNWHPITQEGSGLTGLDTDIACSDVQQNKMKTENSG
jgi:hypothetical protein